MTTTTTGGAAPTGRLRTLRLRSWQRLRRGRGGRGLQHRVGVGLLLWARPCAPHSAAWLRWRRASSAAWLRPRTSLRAAQAAACAAAARGGVIVTRTVWGATCPRAVTKDDCAGCAALSCLSHICGWWSLCAAAVSPRGAGSLYRPLTSPRRHLHAAVGKGWVRTSTLRCGLPPKAAVNSESFAPHWIRWTPRA